MIILDDQDIPLTKSGDNAAGSAVSEDYRTESTRTAHPTRGQTAQQYAQSSQFSAEQAPPPYSLRSVDPSDPLLPYYFNREQSKRARKRFIHALAFAALFWTFTGVFARGVFLLAFSLRDKVDFYLDFVWSYA